MFFAEGGEVVWPADQGVEQKKLQRKNLQQKKLRKRNNGILKRRGNCPAFFSAGLNVYIFKDRAGMKLCISDHAL